MTISNQASDKNGLAVIHIPRCNLTSQDFTTIIDHQMNLQTVKPARRNIWQKSSTLTNNSSKLMARGSFQVHFWFAPKIYPKASPVPLSIIHVILPFLFSLPTVSLEKSNCGFEGRN